MSCFDSVAHYLSSCLWLRLRSLQEHSIKILIEQPTLWGHLWSHTAEPVEMKSKIVQPHLVNGEDKWLVVVLFPRLENAAENEREFRQLQPQKNFQVVKIGVCCLSPPCAYKLCESLLRTICFSRNLHFPCLYSNFVPLSFHSYFKVMVAEALPNTIACILIMCLLCWCGQNGLMSWAGNVCTAQWSAGWHVWAGAHLGRQFNYVNVLIATGGYIGFYSSELAWLSLQRVAQCCRHKTKTGRTRNSVWIS